jgi:hypothetical protein
MSFQVNPGEVANYGELIKRNGVNFAVVNTHLAQYANLGSTDGAFLQMLVGAHDETVNRMRDSIFQGFNTMGPQCRRAEGDSRVLRTKRPGGIDPFLQDFMTRADICRFRSPPRFRVS